MSQPCDCGEDEDGVNVLCWREKCKARYFANSSMLPSGDYLKRFLKVIEKDEKRDE